MAVVHMAVVLGGNCSTVGVSCPRWQLS